ncbi:MAG: hypothetical protein GXY85_10415 [Candidatus Brocadiaceae bacterium]|nr:hypothetical protein [Candidatus Brocadiaceae bacterium]
MSRKPRKPQKPPADPLPEPQGSEPAGALVPTYGVSAVVPGMQAFRRDNVIFYTVRGEPEKVLELVGMLDRNGVNEVVALISHQADDGMARDAAPVRPEEPPRNADD